MGSGFGILWFRVTGCGFAGFRVYRGVVPRPLPRSDPEKTEVNKLSRRVVLDALVACLSCYLVYA